MSIHKIAALRASRIDVAYRAKTFGKTNGSGVFTVDIVHRSRPPRGLKAVPLNFPGCLKGKALALGRGQQRPADFTLGKIHRLTIAAKTNQLIIGTHNHRKKPKSAQMPVPDHRGKCPPGPSFILNRSTIVTSSVRHDEGPIGHVITGTNGNKHEPFCVKGRAGKALCRPIATDRGSVG